MLLYFSLFNNLCDFILMKLKKKVISIFYIYIKLSSNDDTISKWSNNFFDFLNVTYKKKYKSKTFFIYIFIKQLIIFILLKSPKI